MQPPVFVINLARSSERLEAIKGQLDAVGLDFQRIEATDGSKLQASEKGQYKISSKHLIPMHDTEIACFLSHRTAWQEFLKTGLPYGVVLEDDVLLKEGFASIVHNVAPLMPHCDFVRLSSGRRKKFSVDVLAIDKTYKVCYGFHSLNTMGYIVSRRGAERFFKHSAQWISEPIDHYLNNFSNTKTMALIVQPTAVVEMPALGENSNISRKAYGRPVAESITRLKHVDVLVRRNIQHLMNRGWMVRSLIALPGLRSKLRSKLQARNANLVAGFVMDPVKAKPKQALVG